MPKASRDRSLGTLAKNMKPVFLILIASGFLCLSAHGKTLGDAQIRSIVTKAIPDFTITGGDRGWSGGVRSNADMNHVLFDANSAYFLIAPKKSRGTPNAKEIAEEIRDYLIKAFDYPTSRPSSIWSKEQPSGTEPGTFSEVYLRTFPNNNDRSKAMLYMSIQVAQVSPNTYGLTVSYTALGEQ